MLKFGEHDRHEILDKLVLIMELRFDHNWLKQFFYEDYCKKMFNQNITSMKGFRTVIITLGIIMQTNCTKESS
jgi:hypothetical protein